MSRRKPTLEEFMEMSVPNLYIWFDTIECYMRKGPRIVDNEIYNVLTIANVTNRKRYDNAEFKSNHKRTGLFKKFETHVREMAKKYGYDGVYVEIVLNEFLPDVLLRYGYTRVNNRDIGDYQELNYWFPVKDEDGRSG